MSRRHQRRRNDAEIKTHNGSVDEVLGFGNLHVERMDRNAMWARLDRNDGGPSIVMWFVATCDGQLHLKAELEPENANRINTATQRRIAKEIKHGEDQKQRQAPTD